MKAEDKLLLNKASESQKNNLGVQLLAPDEML